MKRHAIAAAAALLFAGSAHAINTNITLDGQVGFSANYFDDDQGDNTNLHNNASRIGIEATASTGGYTGFARYERGMDMYNPNSDFSAGGGESFADDFVRQFYAGLATPYGRATVGRLRAAYARAGQRVDPFYDTSVAGFTGVAGSFGGQGANYGVSNLANGFSDRVLELQSADYDGLQASATVYFDRSGNNDNDYGVGISYARELIQDQPFEVSLQYLEIRNEEISGIPFNSDASVGGSPGKSRNIRASGVYDLGFVALGANFERVDVDRERRARYYYQGSGTVPLNEQLSIAASVAYLDFPTTGNNAPAPIGGLSATLGAFYEVINNLQTYGAVRYVDFSDNPNTSKTWAVAVGASYNFSMTLR